MSALVPPCDLGALAALSAKVGSDPLLIQGAGGNTSVKESGVMWIKASGILLADAETRPIFVPCDVQAMRASMAKGEERADRPAEFVLNGAVLRPSIETSLHAVFRQRVVVHVHCVNTIAIAIRPDAKDVLRERLRGFNWEIVPYQKPGANLAREVMHVLGPLTDVVILSNHGLIIAAETVEDAANLLDRVVSALRVEPVLGAPNMTRLSQRAGDGFTPLPSNHPLHSVACTPFQLHAARQGSLYPDHVIFCGVGVMELPEAESVKAILDRRAKSLLPPPVFLLVEGAGALIRDDASEGAKALARCLGDVLTRLPSTAQVSVLTDAQNAELLDWDAEKYRQSLDAG